jgi:hypothetical protein
MRKRRLKLERALRGATDAMIVKRPRRPETWEVEVFDFGAERLEELLRDLLQILDGVDAPTWSELPGPTDPATDGSGGDRSLDPA